MKIIMYAVAVVLAGWLVIAIAEFKRFYEAGWNNLKAAGMQDKVTFLAEQEQIHAQYYNGKKRHMTYPRKVFLQQLPWIFVDALAVGTLYSAGLEPDEYVGVANLFACAYLTFSFMVYGDFYFTFLMLSGVHNKESYDEAKLEEFYEAQQNQQERIVSVPLLIGFRGLRFVVTIAAIISVFIA